MKVIAALSALCVLVALCLALPSPALEAQLELEPRVPAPTCNVTACKLPACRCSATDIPGALVPAQTPQFVMLTFDDGVTISNIDFYRQALYARRNPNNCSSAATFFVSHEYTDYSLVHELHANGHEIALHSISHEAQTLYWKNASAETLRKEFADQRLIMQKFAKIPVDELKGIRMPFLQMAGNNQFQMLKANNFLYDLSWTTQSFVVPGMWPYSMDYHSTQDCLIGPCPDESLPGTWVIPMINWFDLSGRACSMLDACIDIPDNSTQLADWMKREFLKQYNGNRAPFGVFTHSAWFNVSEEHFVAYNLFLDYLRTLPDVFVSSASEVIDWVKKPIPVAQMKNSTCKAKPAPACSPRACQLIKEGNFERWMTSCIGNCPKSYPWLNNPLGEL